MQFPSYGKAVKSTRSTTFAGLPTYARTLIPSSRDTPDTPSHFPVWRRICLTVLLGLLALVTALHPVPARAANAASGNNFWLNNHELGYITYTYNPGYNSIGYGYGAGYEQALSGDVQLFYGDGAAAELLFCGSSVTYWYSMAWNRGSYEVRIDGQYPETVSANINQYPNDVRRMVGRSWSVTTGCHTLNLRFRNLSGQVMDLDALTVDITNFLPGRYDSSGSEIKYSTNPAWQSYYLSNPLRPWNNTLTLSENQRDLARLTFISSSVYSVHSRNIDRGRVGIVIDGVPLTSSLSDLYGSLQRGHTLGRDGLDNWGYGNTGVARYVHTINIHVPRDKVSYSNGYIVDVDAIDVGVRRLLIAPIQQETPIAGQASNWCWAAVAKAIGEFRSPYVNKTQCQLVSSLKGTPCPNTFGTYLDIQWLLVNHYQSSRGNSAPGVSSFGDIKAMIDGGRAGVIHWSWSTIPFWGNGHFVAIIGYSQAFGNEDIILWIHHQGQSGKNHILGW